MGVIEFELERTIRAPIHDVFARLADINGHNEWMPKRGSILQHPRRTLPGEPALGTTFLDETIYGRRRRNRGVQRAAYVGLPLVKQLQVRPAELKTPGSSMSRNDAGS